jgi:AcrR family transcriptional regulator
MNAGTMKQSKSRIAESRIASRPSLGRRPANIAKIDRQSILDRGFALTQTLALQDISIVRIASELGVTAASIRYHLQGRDALTAGIVNAFYRDLLTRWPQDKGNWQANVSAVGELIYRSYLKHPGIAAYFAAENRFKILASAMKADRDSTMPLFLERYFAVFRQVGLDVARTTSYAIILLQLMHMAAHATTRHQWPGEQKLIDKYLRSLNRDEFPNGGGNCVSRRSETRHFRP